MADWVFKLQLLCVPFFQLFILCLRKWSNTIWHLTPDTWHVAPNKLHFLLLVILPANNARFSISYMRYFSSKHWQKRYRAGGVTGVVRALGGNLLAACTWTKNYEYFMNLCFEAKKTNKKKPIVACSNQPRLHGDNLHQWHIVILLYFYLYPICAEHLEVSRKFFACIFGIPLVIGIYRNLYIKRM